MLGSTGAGAERGSLPWGKTGRGTISMRPWGEDRKRDDKYE